MRLLKLLIISLISVVTMVACTAKKNKSAYEKYLITSFTPYVPDVEEIPNPQNPEIMILMPPVDMMEEITDTTFIGLYLAAPLIDPDEFSAPGWESQEKKINNYLETIDSYGTKTMRMQASFINAGIDKTVYPEKTLLLFTVENNKKILFNPMDKPLEEGKFVTSLLYKKGCTPIWIDIVNPDIAAIESYIGRPFEMAEVTEYRPE